MKADGQVGDLTTGVKDQATDWTELEAFMSFDRVVVRNSDGSLTEYDGEDARFPDLEGPFDYDRYTDDDEFITGRDWVPVRVPNATFDGRMSGSGSDRDQHFYELGGAILDSPANGVYVRIALAGDEWMVLRHRSAGVYPYEVTELLGPEPKTIDEHFDRVNRLPTEWKNTPEDVAGKLAVEGAEQAILDEYPNIDSVYWDARNGLNDPWSTMYLRDVQNFRDAEEAVVMKARGLGVDGNIRGGLNAPDLDLDDEAAVSAAIHRRGREIHDPKVIRAFQSLMADQMDSHGDHDEAHVVRHAPYDVFRKIMLYSMG
jgi:hypothetical protein